MELIPLLKQLSETSGVAGHEGPVREILREVWGQHADEVQTDKLGSLIALKRGSGPEGSTEPLSRAQTEGPVEVPRRRLMLAAHMDEVGLMVSGIEKGFLRITPVGGMDQRALLGLEITVHGRRPLPGVVAARPPHVSPKEEREKPVPWDKLFVDLGLPADEVEELLRVGDPISVRRELVELKGGLVAGKALDNRASLVAVTACLEQLGSLRHIWDVYAVATVQEEAGLRGAIATSYGLEPHLAIAVDVTWGRQAGSPETETFPLGEGPTIGVGPNFHPGVVERLRETAKAHEIPYQTEPLPGSSGTDAWAIQVSRKGVPCGLISIPLRYMHQPVETVAVKDIERAGRLLAAFVAGLEAEFLEKLVWNGTAAG